MTRNALKVFLCAAALVSVTSGCAALVVGGVAGAGTVLYMKGELKDRLQASPEYVRKAISSAIESLEYTKLDAASDNLSGRYEVKNAAGDRISIRYDRVDDRSTDVSIRVGAFGNENLSRAILDEIRRQIPD